jgi:hypothetical protein
LDFFVPEVISKTHLCSILKGPKTPPEAMEPGSPGKPWNIMESIEPKETWDLPGE